MLVFSWVISSAVEHLVYTEAVGGSIPSSPTFYVQEAVMQHSLLSFVYISEKIDTCDVSLERMLSLLKEQYHTLRSLRDIELYNHMRAIHFVQSICREKICVNHLLEIHRILLDRIDDMSKGRLRTIPQNECIFGVPVENISAELEDFCVRMNSEQDADLITHMCEAHNGLLKIAPFFARNYMIARLLIAYVQMREQKPLSLILQNDISQYRAAAKYLNRDMLCDLFKKACADDTILQDNMSQKLDVAEVTSDIGCVEYAVLSTDDMPQDKKSKCRDRCKDRTKVHLLRFSQLAAFAGIKCSTLRYWHSLGMIPVKAYTDGGHALFDVTALHQIQKIQSWKNNGLSIEEILRLQYQKS